MPRRKKGDPTGRGGARAGKPGVAYQNRSDLTQAPSAAPNQVYGQRAAQLRSQASLPLPQQAPPPGAGAGAATPTGTSAQPGGGAPPPQSLGPLNAPTQRPGEPITAGLNTGPGPGPEALQTGVLNPVDEIRAMFAVYPNDDTRRLLAYLDGRP